jgi:O-antigen/teichoic acid export membrane protein
MQKGIIPNVLQLLAYIVSAVSIFILNRYFSNNSFITLAILCFSLPQIFIMIIPFIKIFGRSFKNILAFDKDIFKQIIIRAVKFEGIAVMTTILFQAEYIIMAKTLSPNLIVTYNIFKKVFIFVAFIYTSLLAAFWPVSNELFNSLQYVKLKKMLFKYCYMGIVLVIVYILCAFIFKDFILHMLAPKENIVIGFSFFVLFIIYYIIRVVSDTYSMFLQSINVLKIFWIYTPFRAFISVTAQYFLSLKFGINGIVLGFILAFACTSLWICPYKSYKILSRKIYDIEK